MVGDKNELEAAQCSRLYRTYWHSSTGRTRAMSKVSGSLPDRVGEPALVKQTILADSTSEPLSCCISL